MEYLAPILIAIISSITTLSLAYLTQYKIPTKLKRKLENDKAIDKSHNYLKLDQICERIRRKTNSNGVYIAYFHNGGHLNNGVRMDKCTVVAEDYDETLKPYKPQYKDYLVNNFPYLYHKLLVTNKHFINKLSDLQNQDLSYVNTLKDRNINSSYSFIIKNTINETVIGFISIEYHNELGFKYDYELYIQKCHNEISNLLNMKHKYENQK